jgi:hypothetical protein
LARRGWVSPGPWRHWLPTWLPKKLLASLILLSAAVLPPGSAGPTGQPGGTCRAVPPGRARVPDRRITRETGPLHPGAAAKGARPADRGHRGARGRVGHAHRHHLQLDLPRLDHRPPRSRNQERVLVPRARAGGDGPPD